MKEKKLRELTKSFNDFMRLAKECDLCYGTESLQMDPEQFLECFPPEKYEVHIRKSCYGKIPFTLETKVFGTKFIALLKHSERHLIEDYIDAWEYYNLLESEEGTTKLHQGGKVCLS